MENKLQRSKTRPSYFGNVKTRLGSKLPSSVSQPPGFVSCPWETQPQPRPALEDSGQRHNYHSTVGRPLDHVPHIRNPRLRQYYLQGTTWEPGGLAAKSFEEEQLSSGKVNSLPLAGDTVFSITSQSNDTGASDKTKMNRPPSSSSYSSLLSTASSSLISRQNLCVPMGKAFNQGSSHPPPPPPPTNPDPVLGLAQELKTNPGSASTLLACPHSPSPDAEYDKLLDVEAVPMPDGQLCLLALPPECSEAEGPEAMPYLKLFCRSITDRKGVVSGILLVTAKKIFFDPCKTHPLVMEHGCEEYLLSCSVDALASISFFSDISHVHFNTSTHRWKGKKTIPKSQPVIRPHDGNTGCTSLPNHKGETALVSAAASKLRSSLAPSLSKGGSDEEGADRESRDMDEAERQLEGSPLEELAVEPAGALGVAVFSGASTFCCGGQETAQNKVKMELVHLDDKEKEFNLKNQTGSSRTFQGSSGGLMFVRMRVHRSSGKRKSGGSKTLPRRDNWFTLSQESSDELYAYLSHWRPDLCILEGGEEEGGVEDEEEFVLVSDREEEEEEEGGEEELDMSQKCGRMVEDWEMVSVEDGGGRSASVIETEGLAEIVEQSQILEASHVRELSAELPPRTVGHQWMLAYSTSRHGSSLKSLYRKLSGTDAPVLVVIKDALNQVFGSFLSHPLRPSEKFYGTGETFLFMLHPRFKCFRWTGENSFFIKGDLDSFAIGGGSGHFGLWLDETLCLGRSSPCYTFNNCCLSETDDFRVMELEVWTFC